MAELFGEAFVEGEGGGFGGAVCRRRTGSKSASRFGVKFVKTPPRLTSNSVRGLMISRRGCDRLRGAAISFVPFRCRAARTDHDVAVTFFEHVRQKSLHCIVVCLDVDVVGSVRRVHPMLESTGSLEYVLLPKKPPL